MNLPIRVVRYFYWMLLGLGLLVSADGGQALQTGQIPETLQQIPRQLQEILSKSNTDRLREILLEGNKTAVALTAITDEEEMKIGRTLAQRFNNEHKLVEDNRTQQLQHTGKALAQYVVRKRITYTFQLIQSEEVQAFALPGGHIWVTTALIDSIRTQDELAGILGHEIGHIDSRHCIEGIQIQLAVWKLMSDDGIDQLVRVGYDMIKHGFAPLEEIEADQFGAYFADKAGYDPYRLLDFFIRLEQQEEKAGLYTRPDDNSIEGVLWQFKSFLRSHPLSRERREKLKTYIDTELRKKEVK